MNNCRVKRTAQAQHTYTHCHCVTLLKQSITGHQHVHLVAGGKRSLNQDLWQNQPMFLLISSCSTWFWHLQLLCEMHNKAELLCNYRKRSNGTGRWQVFPVKLRNFNKKCQADFQALQSKTKESLISCVMAILIYLTKTLMWCAWLFSTFLTVE